MPEFPDVTVYVESLARHFAGRRLEGVRVRSAFLLRTADPPLSAATGLRVAGFRRLGKRVVCALEGGLFLVFHLMIAGRFQLREKSAPASRKIDLAAFDFENATLLLTEAGTKKRASLHVVRGEAALAEHDPGGVDPIAASEGEFAAALRGENHTLKRSLTDPRLFSGIGNAYSDEILHAARLSPVKLTSRLADEEVAALRAATRRVLEAWTEKLRSEAGDGIPAKVTAFRDGMAVHGRYGKPCPVCGSSVQRIVYAENEANYCATCQTGGKLLADRSLSKLFRGDWPKTLEEMEALRGRPGPSPP